MLYFLIILALIIISILALRLRVRFEIDDNRRVLFAGLGRSGPEYDFMTKLVTVKLFGMKFKTLTPGEKPKTEKEPKLKKEIKAKPNRVKPFQKIIELIPAASKAFWKYSRSIMKATIIEELNGQIKAGFDSPDRTGQVYGYYQAVAGAVPAIGRNLEYVPIWDEATFSGTARGSVALPLYKLVYRTIILIINLPLREIIKLTIGYKERSHDGQ